MPISPNAKNAIQRLNGFGVTLDPVDDFDTIVRIDEIGKRCEFPFDPDERKNLLSLPIRCGDVDLYRPTFGALFWIEDYANDFFSDDSLIADVAVLFALAHAHQPDVFDALNERTRARKTVKSWAKKSGIMLHDAERALAIIFPDTEEKDSEPSSIAGFFEVLMNAYAGSTVEYWMWEQPIDRIECIMEQASERASDEATDKKSAPNQYAPSVKALKEMRDLVKELVDSRGN